jgi:hypothetical protein
MGKASSAKKVARAARTGGRVSSGQPRGLLFPTAVVLVVLLGVGLVVYARNDRLNNALSGVPQLGDHIHEAIGFDACGDFLPNIPVFETQIGIHTHGDGVMHIHPFSQLGVGANATLGRFLKDAHDEGHLDVSLSDTKLTLLGNTYQVGKTKCPGVTNPTLRVAYWSDVQNAASLPTVTTGSFTSLPLTKNGGGYTVFFGDPKADIPKPPSAPNLAQLGAADSSQTATTATTAKAGATTTTATSSTSTTVAAGSTSSTAAH